MTGEMSQYEADNGDEWAYHREIASYLDGYVRAYDQYLGPQIIAEINGRQEAFFATEFFGKEPNIVILCVEQASGEIWEYLRIGPADKPSEQHFGFTGEVQKED
tara:strand:- start:257 stop:568 length:312 start_codon:yes stop_codon:yes gene_type:complete